MRKIEKEQTTIRLPNELKEQLHRQANSMGISFNALVIILLNRGLQK